MKERKYLITTIRVSKEYNGFPPTPIHSYSITSYLVPIALQRKTKKFGRIRARIPREMVLHRTDTYVRYCTMKYFTITSRSAVTVMMLISRSQTLLWIMHRNVNITMRLWNRQRQVGRRWKWCVGGIILRPRCARPIFFRHITYVEVPMRYGNKFWWHLLLFIAGGNRKNCKGKQPHELEDFDRHAFYHCS